jgi:hypothetical protein
MGKSPTMSRRSSSEDDLARALEREILGPGRVALPCGCVGIVMTKFPKKSWAYISEVTTCCPAHSAWAGDHTRSIWINTQTAEQVTHAELREAWFARAKLDEGDIRLTNRCFMTKTGAIYVKARVWEVTPPNLRKNGHPSWLRPSDVLRQRSSPSGRA